jgi:hypothetical protein
MLEGPDLLQFDGTTVGSNQMQIRMAPPSMSATTRTLSAGRKDVSTAAQRFHKIL